jgi:hypothetical protein
LVVDRVGGLPAAVVFNTTLRKVLGTRFSNPQLENDLLCKNLTSFCC